MSDILCDDTREPKYIAIPDGSDDWQPEVFESYDDAYDSVVDWLTSTDRATPPDRVMIAKVEAIVTEVKPKPEIVGQRIG